MPIFCRRKLSLFTKIPWKEFIHPLRSAETFEPSNGKTNPLDAQTLSLISFRSFVSSCFVKPVCNIVITTLLLDLAYVLASPSVNYWCYY